MGNTCSDAFNYRSQPKFHELHGQEFRKTYSSLRFPQNIAFIHDPKTFRIKEKSSGQGRILKRFTFNNSKDLCQFINNLERIVRLEHDSFLQIYNYSVEKNELNECTISYTLNLVMEHFDHTLQDEFAWRLQARRSFTEEDLFKILSNLVDSLVYLQMKNMSHGNIRPSNIFITADRQVKLMFFGDIPSESSVPAQGQEHPQFSYLAPQARHQCNNSLFSDNESFDLPTNEAFNSSKGDVFALGMVMLELMSMKSVKGLNKDDCERIRQYRITQCNKVYNYSICGLVEAMLKDNELTRPDMIDLQKLIVMEEYIDFASERGVYVRALASPDEELRNVIEMMTYKNNSEKFYVERSSVYTELSILNGLNDEKDKRKRRGPEVESIELGHELSPTKANTSPREGSQDRKDQDEVRNLILKDLEDGFGFHQEMLVENEGDFQQAMSVELHKLIISFEEQLYKKELGSMIIDLLRNQPLVKDLMLALSKMKLGDEGLDTVCQGLAQIKEVERCYLDLRKNKISIKGLKDMKNSLMDKPKLVQLGLNLSDNRIHDDGCKEVASWFEGLATVTSLALNLGGNKISNEGLISLGKGLEDLKVLECAVIFLHANEIEGGEGILELLEALKRMESVKKVKIDLSGNMLGDEEIEILLAFIGGSQMEEITIELRDNCMSEAGRTRLLEEVRNTDKVNIIF